MDMKPLAAERARSSRALKFWIFALFAAIVFLLAKIPLVAEYVFARGITRGLSWFINGITNFLPFSLYECAAVLLVLGAAALLAGSVYLLSKKRFARFRTWMYRTGLALLAVLLAFGVLYSPLYSRGSAFTALGLSETELTEEKVVAAAEYYVDRLNTLASRADRDEEGNILPTKTFGELAREVNSEFRSFKGGYFASFEVRPKAVALSVPMSYLGITGIYFPFFAEANVNVNIPAYELPFTMAHEIAHAKGVSSESEANLTAYVLCICADDAYLNYSGLMRAVSNLLNALPDEEYERLRGLLSPEVLQEYRNANEHYAKYEGAIDTISTFFNDLFLKSNGIASGTRNYGETTQGLVALYERLAG